MSAIKVRELHRLPLTRHWVIVSEGVAVADIYGKRGEFTTVVRAHSMERLAGSRVATQADLDSAVADFTSRWSA